MTPRYQSIRNCPFVASRYSHVDAANIPAGRALSQALVRTIAGRTPPSLAARSPRSPATSATPRRRSRRRARRRGWRAPRPRQGVRSAHSSAWLHGSVRIWSVPNLSVNASLMSPRRMWSRPTTAEPTRPRRDLNRQQRRPAAASPPRRASNLKKTPILQSIASGTSPTSPPRTSHRDRQSTRTPSSSIPPPKGQAPTHTWTYSAAYRSDRRRRTRNH